MTTFNKLTILFLLILLGGCVHDPSTKTENLKSDSTVELTQKTQPEVKPDLKNLGVDMPKVKIEVEIPKKEDWVLEREISLSDFQPLGIAHHMGKVYVSDTVQNIVIGIELEDETTDTIMHDSKVAYLNKRVGKLLMPMISKDSIFVYRGTKRGLYKFEFDVELYHPTSFDGFKITDNVIVDRGNNRLVRNLGEEMTIIGSAGTSDGQFATPTSAHVAGGSIHVTDTGNKRVQVFSLDSGAFIRTYGENENLMAPTGITSDEKNIFVCDGGTNAIYIYTSSGKLIYKLSDGIESPTDVYFEKGKLYVSDASGAAVKIFSNKVYDSES